MVGKKWKQVKYGEGVLGLLCHEEHEAKRYECVRELITDHISFFFSFFNHDRSGPSLYNSVTPMCN